MLCTFTFLFGNVMINTGCQSANPTVNLVANLAVRAGIVAAVTSNPGLAPVLNSVADVLMRPQDQLSPAKVHDAALKAITDANWPENYKLLASASLSDVMLVYEDFYNKHRSDLTDSELALVLNRIGTSIKIGANPMTAGEGEVPSVQARSGLIVNVN